jgi:uncharacterized protein YbcC (UPF0753/DUF2309 family)
MKNQVLTSTSSLKEMKLETVARDACKKIAPVWPLENFVAVNPYMGFSNEKFDNTAQKLAAIGGVQMTLPTTFYTNKIAEGKITQDDIAVALAKKSVTDKSAASFLKQLKVTNETSKASIKTFIDVAAAYTGKDWNRFVVARISNWAASYFDNGQAIWAAANKQAGLFAAWKSEAEIDRTTEIAGLKNFRKHVIALPNEPMQAMQKALEILNVDQNEVDTYLHRLLLRLGGWSAYTARLDWDSELYGGKDGKLIEFLAVLVSWEAALFQSIQNETLIARWNEEKKQFTKSKVQSKINKRLAENLILQEAFDLATQRELIAKFKQIKSVPKTTDVQPKAQAIFCIDVRSEVYRRNLELVDNEIETIGFAGFFAFSINYVPLAHQHGEAQCPVLIQTGPTIIETLADEKNSKKAHQSRVLKQQVKQLWKSFKSGAVSCFSYVSPIGLSYLPKLFTDTYGLTRPVPNPNDAGLSKVEASQKRISLEVAEHNNAAVGIPVEQRITMAKNALNAMSLTENFGRFVLIVGHGSTSVNNPHAAGLDCGACGGHTGEANAKVAAAVLNDKAVREALKSEGINVPDNTVFLACLHDTTTDEIRIYNEYEVSSDRAAELAELKESLSKAGHGARAERAMRMSVNVNVDAAVKGRSNDWSQVRPEWGLAGCNAFVVAPRERTKNLNFGGQSFLHSYNWKKDNNFSVLELIMTAPMVVTNWINLQYYASTVDNKVYGSGNKTLHNVTAGVGVLEGFSGDLRVGLPLQSVHDGEKYQHEPTKLNVIIEAPIEAMNAILAKHDNVRNLCDNGWLHLLAMDEEGKVSHRYARDLNWEAV